jgi:hypothetical protein
MIFKKDLDLFFLYIILYMDFNTDKLYHVSEIYGAFINYGYNVRKTKKSGYDAWIIIKEKIPEQLVTWKSSIGNEYYNHLTSNLGIKDVKPVNLDQLGQNDWERNYFLLQHGRIMRKYPQASLVKIFQIAYNTGQFIAENEREPYSQAILQYFVNKQLNKLSSFIEMNSLKEVDPKIYTKIYNILRNIIIGDNTALVNNIESYSDIKTENEKIELKNIANNSNEQFNKASEKKEQKENNTSSEQSSSSNSSSSEGNTNMSATSSVRPPPGAANNLTSSEMPVPTQAPSTIKKIIGGKLDNHLFDYLRALKNY